MFPNIFPQISKDVLLAGGGSRHWQPFGNSAMVVSSPVSWQGAQLSPLWQSLHQSDR